MNPRGNFENYLKLSQVVVPIKTKTEFLPFPAYEFPKLNELTNSLHTQYNIMSKIEKNNVNSFLNLKFEEYIYLKGLVTQLNSKLKKATGLPEDINIRFSITYESLLLLALRMKSMTIKMQQVEINNIIMVMQDFANIEACLIDKYKETNKIHNIITALDIVFDNWLYNLFKKTTSVGSYSWRRHFNNSRILLKEELSKFLSNANDKNNIERCFDISTEIISEKKTTIKQFITSNSRIKNLYTQMRNEFLFICFQVGAYLPEKFVITFEFIKQCGDLICSSKPTIDNILNFAELLKMPKAEIRLFAGLLTFYCNSKKELTSNEIVRFMIVAHKYKEGSKNKEENKSSSKEIIPYIEEMNQNIKKDLASSVLQKKQHVSKTKSMNKEEVNEKKIEKKEFYSTHSGPTTRAINDTKKSVIDTITEKINETGISMQEKAALTALLFAITRTYDFRPLLKFGRSLLAHAHRSIGITERGRVPKTPSELIKEGAVLPVLKRLHIIPNMIALTSVFATIYKDTIESTLIELNEYKIKIGEILSLKKDTNDENDTNAEDYLEED